MRVYLHRPSVKDDDEDDEESETLTTDLVVPESLHLLLIGRLSHLEDQRGLAKPEILRGNVTVQEDVDACRDERKLMLIVKWTTTQHDCLSGSDLCFNNYRHETGQS